MPPGCPDSGKQSGATLNVCHSHCSGVQHFLAYADVPVPPIAPPRLLLIRLDDAYTPALTASLPLNANAAAPPLQVRFARFLI